MVIIPEKTTFELPGEDMVGDGESEVGGTVVASGLALALSVGESVGITVIVAVGLTEGATVGVDLGGFGV
jgi:hypothetical protein